MESLREKRNRNACKIHQGNLKSETWNERLELDV
jgi:hypothetical protein